MQTVYRSSKSCMIVEKVQETEPRQYRPLSLPVLYKYIIAHITYTLACSQTLSLSLSRSFQPFIFPVCHFLFLSSSTPPPLPPLPPPGRATNDRVEPQCRDIKILTTFSVVFLRLYVEHRRNEDPGCTILWVAQGWGGGGGRHYWQYY